MGRFFDDVRAAVQPNLGRFDDPQIFDKAVVIIAQNVADYCNIADPKRRKYLEDEHLMKLPSVVPPFQVSWVEFRLPEVGQVGILTTRQEVDEIENKGLRKQLQREIKQGTDIRWHIRSNLFWSPRSIPNTSQAAITYWIDSDMKPLSMRRMDNDSVMNMVTKEIVPPGEKVKSLFHIELMTSGSFHQLYSLLRVRGENDTAATHLTDQVYFISQAMRIVMWTFAFFQIKNVVIEDRQPPEKPSKLHQKRHGVPLTTYKVIKVSPMGRSSGQAKGGQHSAPVEHLVHGHPRTFTDEGGGLFGKLVGTYWWNDFMRGKPERGSVKKSYEVETDNYDPSQDSHS